MNDPAIIITVLLCLLAGIVLYGLWRALRNPFDVLDSDCEHRDEPRRGTPTDGSPRIKD